MLNFLFLNLTIVIYKLTFFWANILILFRTTSIPLSFEALSSRTESLKADPSKTLARHKIVVVLPTPGGPAMMIFGALPCFAKTANLWIVSSFPTMSSKTCGLYFSILKNKFPSFVYSNNGLFTFLKSVCWLASQNLLAEVFVYTLLFMFTFFLFISVFVYISFPCNNCFCLW